MAVVAYNPLAGGLLTGKHATGTPPAAGTRFDGNRTYLDRYWHDSYFEAQREAGAIARQAGLTTTELAFRWLLTQPAVDCVLLGASSLVQLEENLKACEGPALEPAVLTACDSIWEKLRGATPRYNR